MAEFTAEEALLKLVASGNAEVAELLRLKDFIPPVFAQDKIDAKYADIIHDFSYFQKSDAITKRLAGNAELQAADAAFCEQYIDILTRFYQSFESIHLYVLELRSILQELEEGVFIQQTLESVLQNNEGRQLLIESVYLYGVMLLVVDQYIPHVTRERLLVSYYRYRTETQGESTIDEVCKLLRSTGEEGKKSATYPEDYFARFPINETVVEMICAHLRTDDIYHQIPIYPLPEHRTTALASQAAMLYVTLFFTPATLHRGQARMREIVDKFFPDQWTISLYMGQTANLIDTWSAFRAARTALGNTLTPENVRHVAAEQRRSCAKCLSQVGSVLKDCDQLSERFVTKNMAKMMALLRRCNVTLRWFVLHLAENGNGGGVARLQRSKEADKVWRIVCTESGVDKVRVFELLQCVSQLEVRVRDVVRALLDEKDERWTRFRSGAARRLDELMAVFTGATPVLNIVANPELGRWFADISAGVKALELAEPVAAERKLIQVIKALEEVQQFHNLESNMQVKQHLNESLDDLHQMLHTINVTEATLINIQVIGDLSYAWREIHNYTAVMRDSIARPPYLVINLRAIFLKLASALEIPLLRINQAHSDDLESVSHYYSQQLVEYVRLVVGIIPKNIFQLITQRIYDETRALKQLPAAARIEKTQLRDYAQLDRRRGIASVAENVTALTEGILQMRKTLVGVIEVDPMELLEQGIRAELAVELREVIRRDLWFDEKAAAASAANMAERLAHVIESVDRYRWAFEYVQDYLHINGAKLFEEEMARMCNECAAHEISQLMAAHRPRRQNAQPRAHATEPSANVVGNFARTLLRLTDPLQTVYIEKNRHWLPASGRDNRERLNIKFIGRLTNTIGPAFLVGLDRFLTQLAFTDLEDFFTALEAWLTSNSVLSEALQLLQQSQKSGETPAPAVVEQTMSKHSARFSSKLLARFVAWTMNVGRVQLLRNEFRLELNQMCRVSSQQLEASLQTLNGAVMLQLSAGQKSVPGSDDAQAAEGGGVPDTQMLCELSEYLLYAGLHNPMHKVYVLVGRKTARLCAGFLFVLVTRTLERVSAPTAGGHQELDDAPFVVGVATLLRQLHADVSAAFVQLMCQFIVVHMRLSIRHDTFDLHTEAVQAMRILTAIMSQLNISRDVLEQHIPQTLYTQFEYLARCGETSGAFRMLTVVG